MRITKFGLNRKEAKISLALALIIGIAVPTLLIADGAHSAREASHAATFYVARDDSGAPANVSFAAGFAPIVKSALPAVVNVSTSKTVRTAGGGFVMPFSNDPFFRRFFGDQFGEELQTPREQREHSLGSGVIVSPDGYILTNNHVVEGATEIEVALSDKREFKAKLVGTDPKTDVAVLKIEGSKLPTLTLGDSSKMDVGDFVLAIGDPFGVGETVTMGIVSATGRATGLGIEDYEDFIQTDAAINPGNSGGALIDVHGDLIGINTAIMTNGGGGNQGVGFAIPIDLARKVMDQILQHGRVIRGYLGVMIQDVNPDLASAFGLKQTTGALVGDVTPGSPAAHAGLTKGDVLLEMNGQPVSDVNELRLRVAQTSPGTTVRFKVYRDGRDREIAVTLGELPEKLERTESGDQSRGALEGVQVQELTSGIVQQLGLPVGTRGVVVADVRATSPAADAGLQRGDVIQEVNRRAVNNLAQYQEAVAQASKQPVLLLINRGGTSHYVVLKPR